MKYYVMRAEENEIESILRLQKRAFTSVAEKENNFKIKPMVQSLDEIIEEYKQKIFLKTVDENNVIIGSVRAQVDDNGVCQIGRLIVDPNYQNKGIGTEMMIRIEQEFENANQYYIFTSKLSNDIIRLYEKLEYKIIKEFDAEGVLMVGMVKYEKVHSNY